MQWNLVLHCELAAAVNPCQVPVSKASRIAFTLRMAQQCVRVCVCVCAVVCICAKPKLRHVVSFPGSGHFAAKPKGIG